MTITRIDADARWSDAVIHNQTLYYTGVPENLDADAFEQTANTWRRLTPCWPDRVAIRRVFWMRQSFWWIKVISRR